MINLNELEVLPNEVWKLHEIGIAVSNLGRVFVPKSRGHSAYYSYGSDKSGRYLRAKNKNIHVLVAECFIPNPNNYPTVDHINRNKHDNRVENLRWTTYSEQALNRNNKNRPKNNAKSKQVAQIDPKTNEIIRIYPSANECGRNGFNHGCISSCCLGKRKFHKGYIWKYVA